VFGFTAISPGNPLTVMLAARTLETDGSVPLVGWVEVDVEDGVVWPALLEDEVISEEVVDDVPWIGVLVCEVSVTNAIVAIARTITTATTITAVPIPLRRGVTQIHLSPRQFLINSFVRTTNGDLPSQAAS
jgi:hypothetical protein